ncbi:MAG: thymidine kinase [Bacilli bacterium]|nr:thymidine kinase [Bacilli bacterium]
MAKLLFKYATMNSGKTIDLLRTAYNYEENNGNILVLKPKVDTKGKDKITSRVGLERKVDYIVCYDDSLLELLKGNLKDIDAILVDEAQFFSKTQIEELSIISKVMHIDVICYGLRINFRGELFEGSKKLFEVADALDELVTLCECRNVARFVGRKVNGVYKMNGPEVIIDGSDDTVEYVPLCKECYLQKVKGISFKEIKDKLK